MMSYNELKINISVLCKVYECHILLLKFCNIYPVIGGDLCIVKIHSHCNITKMKKIIFIIAGTMTIMAGTIFISCQSSIQKQEAAQEKVQDAKQELNTAQKDANAAAKVVATAEEWKVFRTESELEIKANELRSAELKVKLKKPGEIFDGIYEKKIISLDQQNKDMRARLLAYENSQSNWESFKREFNHDMDEIGQALKDLTVDNKK